MNGCLHVINFLFFFSVCALFTGVLLHVVGGESGKVFFGICACATTCSYCRINWNAQLYSGVNCIRKKKELVCPSSTHLNSPFYNWVLEAKLTLLRYKLCYFWNLNHSVIVLTTQELSNHQIHCEMAKSTLFYLVHFKLQQTMMRFFSYHAL